MKPYRTFSKTKEYPLNPVKINSKEMIKICEWKWHPKCIKRSLFCSWQINSLVWRILLPHKVYTGIFSICFTNLFECSRVNPKVFERSLKIAAECTRRSQVAGHQENIFQMEFKPDFFQGLISNSHVHLNHSIHDLKKNN